MGLSSRSQKSSTKPIYSQQIEGAANNISGAYSAAAPKITAVTDALGTLTPGLLDRFTSGDPGVNAATTYNTAVLNGEMMGQNPYLQAVLDKSANTARNQSAAALGVRGLNGGSAFTDIVSRNISDAANGVLYTDYNNERQRQAQAAALAPSLAAAGYLPIQALQEIAQAQSMPVQTAAGAGSAIGGLLGAYTNQKTTASPSLMDSIGQAINIGKSVAGLFPTKGG